VKQELTAVLVNEGILNQPQIVPFNKYPSMCNASPLVYKVFGGEILTHSVTIGLGYV